jgi:two-component system, cell cycle response regulator DivK
MPYTLLVVEASENNRDMLATLLRRNGYRVLEAGSGAEALNLAAQDPIDLILLDLSLTDLDDGAILRRMQALPGLAGVPIIGVSTQDRPGAPEATHAAACAGYITRPIALASFLDLLARHLRQTPPGPPDTVPGP